MIILDEREDPALVQLIRREAERRGVTVISKMLDICDVIVRAGGIDICIEHKEVRDLVDSIIDGRLWRQLYAMSSSYYLSYLFIVGKWEDIASRNIRREAVLGLYVTLPLKVANTGIRGIIIPVWVETWEDYVNSIMYIHKKLSEGELEIIPRSPALSRLRKREAHTRHIVECMLMCLPGIGEKTARELSRTYQTLPELVLNAEDVIRKIRDEEARSILRQLLGLA